MKKPNIVNPNQVGNEQSKESYSQDKLVKVFAFPWILIRGNPLAWIVFFMLILISSLMWYFSRHIMLSHARERFDYQIQKIHSTIEQRLHVQERALLGGAGLFSASNSVDREEWKKYVKALDINKNYPGMQGIGYSVLVPKHNRSQFVRQVRSEGFPDFNIKPEGEREIYTSIVFLEPLDWRNKRAFGFDMFTEPVRRAALERARDSGQVSMTGKVQLMQETDTNVQNGFLIYMPVYKKGLPLETIEQRQRALQGYVYSPFRIADFMQELFTVEEKYIDFEIYDGDAVSTETQLYDHDGHTKRVDELSERIFFQNSHIVFGGRRWTFHFSAFPEFILPVEHLQSYLVAAGGGVIAIIIFIIISSIARKHRNALAYAKDIGESAMANAVRVQAVINTVVDGVITINERGIVESVNPAGQKIFQYQEKEMVGQNIKMLMPEPDHSRHDGYLKAYHETGIAKIIGNKRDVYGRRRDGSTFPLELAVSPVNTEGKTGYVGILRDVSERRESSRQLIMTIQELEGRTREMAALSNLGDVLQTCKDLDEAYKVVQGTLPKIIQKYSGALFVVNEKSSQLDLVSQWGVTSYAKTITNHDCMAIRRGVPFMSRRDEEVLTCTHFEPRQPVLSFCIPLMAQGATIGLLSLYEQELPKDELLVEIGEQEKELIIATSKQISMAIANLTLRHRLEQQSIHDALTGLHNRRFLQEMLPKEIQRELRHEQPCLTILILDVDHFKKVNDTYGHAAGDKVLREVARVLGAHTRREDLVCRYGGEEFVVVLPKMPGKNAVEKANLLREEVKRLRIDVDGIRVAPVTISIGLASLPEHGVTDESLLHEADLALYAAKESGRDRVVVAGMNEQATKNKIVS